MKTLTDIRGALASHPLRMAEIPVEHAQSWILPTLVPQHPAYIVSFSPAVRRVQQPVIQSGPDRWVLFDAQSGRVMLFASYDFLPFNRKHPTWEPVTITPDLFAVSSVAELQQLQSQAIQKLEALTPAFFENGSTDASARAEVLQLMNSLIPAPLLEQHRAMAPDFFAWLGA